MVATVPAGDLGSDRVQMGTRNHLIPVSSATSLPPPRVAVDLRTPPILPELPVSPLVGSLSLLSSLALVVRPHPYHPGKNTEDWLCPVPTGGQVAGREEVPRGGHAIPLEQSQPGWSHLP